MADDLLKNDGQKFLEMMEQLAERRMQREEEAAASVEEDSEDEEEEDVDEEDEEEEEKESDWLVGVSMTSGESDGSGFTVCVPSVSGISSTKETCFD